MLFFWHALSYFPSLSRTRLFAHAPSCFLLLYSDILSDHTRQLERLAEGHGGEAIAAAFEEILSRDDSAAFSFCARAFGGGAWRAALTFEALVARVVPWPRRLLATSITVDEMWGGRVHAYSPATKHDLVGSEFRYDGSCRHVRVTLSDTSPGSTYGAVA